MRFWSPVGKDSDSILADPEFDADASGSGGFALKPTSPAIAKLGEKKRRNAFLFCAPFSREKSLFVKTASGQNNVGNVEGCERFLSQVLCLLI